MTLQLITLAVTLGVLLAAAAWHIGRGVRQGIKDHRAARHNRKP